LAEATTFGTSIDPTFSAVTFGTYKFSSKPVFVSSEILQDSAFDLGGVIGGMLGERLGRIEGTYTTTGTGSGQPEGIQYAAAAGQAAASQTAFTADEVLGLVHSVDPAYRALSSVGFMMHDTILLYARKLKDANGAYLWMPGLQAGVPDRLVGYPISINQQMDSALTTTKRVMLFGAFEKFIIRDAGGVRFYRLEERYRDLDQTAFVAFKRMDSKMLQSAAIKRLTLA
jgi:HK97 family phage major capsid protein